MNAKNFMLALRKAIREEVRAAVRQEVKQLLQEQSRPTAPSPKRQQSVQQKRTPPVSFDGPLASILNETAQSMYTTPEQNEWQDMGGGTFTADQAQGFGLAALMNQETVVADSAPTHYSGDPTMAFIKDYSSVMKAADKFSNRE